MNNIVRSFALGNYDWPEGADQFFERVDGFEDPMRLLGFEDTGIEFADGAICSAIQNVRESMKGPMPTQRSAADYVDYVNFMAERRYDLIRAIADLLGVDAVSLLDAGCGKGVALRQFLQLPCVDADRSVGIGLPILRSPFNRFNEKILPLNIAHLVPRVDRRFDVVMSMFGVVTYHPFNDPHPTDLLRSGRTEDNIPFFGPLHILNFVEEGGFIFDQSIVYPFGEDYSVHNRTGPAFDRLCRMGILTPCKEIQKYEQSGITASGILRLKRRPTEHEVRDLLSIREETGYMLCMQ